MPYCLLVTICYVNLLHLKFKELLSLILLTIVYLSKILLHISLNVI